MWMKGMFMKTILILIAITLMVIEGHAKVHPGKRVAPVIYNGAVYEKSNGEDGYVVKRDVQTGRIEWTCQVYVIAYETKSGLSKCVQGCRITELAISKRKLLVTNEKGWTYELNIDDLNVVATKGSRIIKSDIP